MLNCIRNPNKINDFINEISVRTSAFFLRLDLTIYCAHNSKIQFLRFSPILHSLFGYVKKVWMKGNVHTSTADHPAHLFFYTLIPFFPRPNFSYSRFKKIIINTSNDWFANGIDHPMGWKFSLVNQKNKSETDMWKH